MNHELYKESERRVLRRINAILVPLTAEMLEDVVADVAEYHDEQNDFNTNWGADVAEVYPQICYRFGVEPE